MHVFEGIGVQDEDIFREIHPNGIRKIKKPSTLRKHKRQIAVVKNIIHFAFWADHLSNTTNNKQEQFSDLTSQHIFRKQKSMCKHNFIQEACIDPCWIIFFQFSTYRQAWKNLLSRRETAEDSEKKQTEDPPKLHCPQRCHYLCLNLARMCQAAFNKPRILLWTLTEREGSLSQKHLRKLVWCQQSWDPNQLLLILIPVLQPQGTPEAPLTAGLGQTRGHCSGRPLTTLWTTAHHACVDTPCFKTLHESNPHANPSVSLGKLPPHPKSTQAGLWD